MQSSKVYVGMCADVLHVGHINLLNEAERYGNVIVGLLSDDAIQSYKGKPLMPYWHRYRIVASLKQVYCVVGQNTLDYADNLRLLKPDFVVHADDWKTGVQAETRQKVIDTLAEWGGQLIEPPYTKGVSSTILKKGLA